MSVKYGENKSGGNTSSRTVPFGYEAQEPKRERERKKSVGSRLVSF